MFKKLRNRFIATNMMLTSVVLVSAFGAIYLISYNSTRAENERILEATPVFVRRIAGTSQGIVQDFTQERIDDSNRALKRLLGTLIVTGLATLVLVFFASWYFAEESIKPVREAWRKQERFIADASHELKTPLAAIDANLEALLSDYEIKSKWSGNIKKELARMDGLVKDLLKLARVEAGDVEAQKTRFDLGKLVDGLLTSMEARIFEKDIRLTKSVEPGLVLDGDMAGAERVLGILMDNAIKYCNKEIEVVVRRSEKSKSWLEVIVRNDGKKIAGKDLEHVFDRFYRTSKSRSENGYGLGLAIAKAEVERMGGKISVGSGDVTEFKFCLKG